MTFHNRDHLLNKGYLMTKFEVHATFTSWDNVFTRFSDFDLWWPKMTFGLHGKQNRSSTHQGLSTYPVWSSGNFHLLEIMCLQGFQTSTSGDLDLHGKTLGIIYPTRAINIPSLKFQQLSLIEIPCLQGFQTLTSGDLKWPLSSMKNNRDHLPTKGYQHTKFEVQATFHFIEIPCLQGFQTLTSGDLKWPLTFMKNNRDHLLTTPTYQAWSSSNIYFLRYRVYKPKRHTHTHIHTHTHTHTSHHHRIDSFGLRQGIKKTSLSGGFYW